MRDKGRFRRSNFTRGPVQGHMTRQCHGHDWTRDLRTSRPREDPAPALKKMTHQAKGTTF